MTGKYRKTASKCADAVTCNVTLKLTDCKCDVDTDKGKCITCEKSKIIMAETPTKCIPAIVGCSIYDNTSTNTVGKCKTCLPNHF